MDERIMQFRVGVVVVAVTLIAGFLTLLFGHFPASVLHRTNTIYVNFSPGAGRGRRHAGPQERHSDRPCHES